MKFNMIYQPPMKIRTVLALLCAVSISFFLISGTLNKSKSQDKFDREIIIRHLEQIKPTELENYISTDKLLTTNPKARIFTIHYAFKKWGPVTEKNPVYHYYLISDYLSLRKAEEAYLSYHTIYDLKHPLHPKSTNKIEMYAIKKELFTLLYMNRRVNSRHEWLRPFVVNKASEFLNNHPELTEDQRELPERIIQTAKNIKEKQKKLGEELEHVKELVTEFMKKESQLLEQKDFKGYKEFILSNSTDRQWALGYCEITIDLFAKYDEIEFNVKGVEKTHVNGYFVYYSWTTVPSFETDGDGDYSGTANSRFVIKHDKIFLTY